MFDGEKKAIKNTQISNLTSQKHKLELYNCANVSSLTNISKTTKLILNKF